MRATKHGTDLRQWCDENGVWLGAVLVPHEDLPTAYRRLILEGQPFDAPLPHSRDRLRLWPAKLVDCRGIGPGACGDRGITVWCLYELVFCYGRR